MHLTVLKRPLVRFSDVHGGYLEGATLTFNVEYEPELEVTSQDWVAIIPAGSNDLRQFVSFQIAPMHNEACRRMFDADTNGNEAQSGRRPHTHSICFDPQFAPRPYKSEPTIQSGTEQSNRHRTKRGSSRAVQHGALAGKNHVEPHESCRVSYGVGSTVPSPIGLSARFYRVAQIRRSKLYRVVICS
uniref:Uncharacterized protein n=1 Tax=Ascaris lumbricoides TaxID=6252 RepID=A0A0M3I7N6_ASCLU